MLEPILDAARLRLPQLRQTSEALRAAAAAVPHRPRLAEALVADELTVIAEIKRRSPSRGDLAPDLDPADQARHYTSGGASAISVLTEPEFFAGSGADLEAVVAAVDVPVLRKDFILDEVQVWEAAGWGASAILLIVAALDDSQLSRLIGAAADVELEALVEVHDEDEARRAIAAGATLVGVNNRDLSTFDVDLATAERIAPLLDSVPVKVAESGVFTGEHAQRMAAAGYQAVLVGEALVRAKDPSALVRELRVPT